MFLSFFFSWSQEKYTKGVILDSISVVNNPEETFALYLPKTYKRDRPTPILLIFDPSARGKSGLAPFLSTSEKYGYILVCSNNSRNGPVDKNIPIASRLFDHLFSIFNIDEKQVFLSGFSGGSRLASRIALLSDDITAVVGCGAGFSADARFLTKHSRFLYAGICGSRDMNYSEMIGLTPFLEYLGQPFTIQTYDGNHRWPPPEEIEKAFDWINVQLYKQKIITLTSNTLKELYEKSYISAVRNKNNYLQVAEDFERIQSAYSDIFETDSITDKLKTIKKNKGYKTASKSLANALEQEKNLTKTYVERITLDLKNIDEKNLNWWRKELEKLKKRHQNEDEEMRKMIDRLRFKIFAYLYERANPNLNNNINNLQLNYSKKIIGLLKATYSS